MTGLWRRYGASPGHLVALVLGGAVSAYAVTRVPSLPALVAIGVWFVAMLLAHDLVLFPVYAALDNAVRRVRGAARSGGRGVPWINHLRVPVVFSGLLLIAWFPLILGLSKGYQGSTGRSIDPFLGRWLLVTVVLFAASGLLYAGRVARRRRASAAPSP